jgi:hypothetical protein
VLLHSGDTVGNYGRADVNVHFKEFAEEFLAKQAKRFEQVTSDSVCCFGGLS